MEYVDNPFKSPAILSLCTGMRGLERGLERVLGPVRTIAHVEIEAFVIENLVRQMEQGVLAPTPIWSNLKTFPAREFYGKVHGITGGYPCQPFSAAGQRKGTDDPRHLWPFINNIIKKSRPVWCFFENVEGHLSLGLRDVLADLRKLGYQTEVGLFSAAETGAPHRRNRVFILGLENSFIIRMRGWNDEQRENWRREIQTTRSSELVDTRCIIRQSDCERRLDLEQNALEETRRQENSNITSIPSRESEGVGISNSFSQRLEVGGVEPARQEFQAAQRSSDWPSRSGQPQHEWESPRLESSLGYAVNGYNFREDLLRMAGNAVVEQTAEIAFRNLIQKFL